MNKKVVITTLIIASLSVFAAAKIQLSSTAPEIEEPKLVVQSMLRSYGREETLVFKIKNSSDRNILFPDNYYGLNLFKRESSGVWQQVILPLEFIPTIHTIFSDEEVEVEIRHSLITEGEYKVVFEGWYRDDHYNLIKGETRFFVHPFPTFSTEILTRHLKGSSSIPIQVINDRQDTLVFNDTNLGLRLFIKNEGGYWMELPPPLYSDNTPLILEPNEKHILELPPLRASGHYKIELYGIEQKSGLRVRNVLEFNVR